jgi:hypothetical protein
VILLISASQVIRITGVSHWHLALDIIVLWHCMSRCFLNLVPSQVTAVTGSIAKLWGEGLWQLSSFIGALFWGHR